MAKIPLIPACAVLLGMTLGGCAGQPTAPSAAPRVAAVEQDPVPRHCLRETNGRLPVTGECTAARGLVLSREDLERAGDIRVGDAIRRRVPF